MVARQTGKATIPQHAGKPPRTLPNFLVLPKASNFLKKIRICAGRVRHACPDDRSLMVPGRAPGGRDWPCSLEALARRRGRMCRLGPQAAPMRVHGRAHWVVTRQGGSGAGCKANALKNHR